MSTTEAKTIELNQTTLDLAGKIEPLITVVDGKPDFDKDTFEKTLPENLDLKTVKAVQRHINHFEAAANFAFGRVGIPHFQNNPEVSALISSVKVGHDTYNVAMARTQSVSAGVGVGRKEVFGNITSGIKSSNPEAKRAINQIRAEAEVLAAQNNG